MIESVFIYRLVSGAGDIKLTKDGNVLLHEMVIIICSPMYTPLFIIAQKLQTVITYIIVHSVCIFC